jgi:AcrR family transcriptional regulator
MGAVAAPKRLAPDVRREQLIDTALAIAAAEGVEGLGFARVAERAGVTRNLVYHYFPGGRSELLRAAVHRAGALLTGEWSTDGSTPLPERLATNLERMIDHASEPSDAWRLHRQSRGSVDPDVIAIAAAYRETVIANISTNHLGTPTPPPLVRIALEGFLAFGEAALDSWRGSGVPKPELVQMLGSTLVATIEAAVTVGPAPAEGNGRR